MEGEEELVAWEWQDVDSGDWRNYDIESTQQIEEAYVGNTVVVALSHGFFSTSGGYTVDLSQMTQTRDSSGFRRPIRRIPPVPPLSSNTAGKKKASRKTEPKLETIRCPSRTRRELNFALGLFSRREGESLDAPPEEIVL